MSIQTRVIPEVPGSTRWTPAQQRASPPSPGISPPDHSAGCPGWGGGGAHLPRVTRGDSPQAPAGPHLGRLVHLSCSPPPPQSKTPQECNNSGVGGMWGGWWQAAEPRAPLRQRAGRSARVLRQKKAPRDPSHYQQAISPVQLMGSDIQ